MNKNVTKTEKNKTNKKNGTKKEQNNTIKTMPMKKSARMVTKEVIKDVVNTYFIGKGGVLYLKTFDCKTNCTLKGICLNSTCFCNQGIHFFKLGYASSDCSMTYKEYNGRGFEVDSIVRWSIYVFISSTIITLTYLIIMKIS